MIDSVIQEDYTTQTKENTMIDIRVQAGGGGADASDFAKSLAKMITKTTGQEPVVEGSEILFNRL